MTLLLLATLALQDGRRITIKYVDGAEETVEVIAHDARGMRARIEGVDYDVWINYTDLDPRTVAATKQLLAGASPAVAPRRGIFVPGVRVTLDDGVVEGVRLPTTDANAIHVKTASGTHVIARTDARRIEDVDVDMRLVYTPDEIYAKLFEQFHPSRPAEWSALGQELNRAGLGDRALKAFRIAGVLGEPQVPEHGLYEAVGRLYAAMIDVTAREAVGRMQEASHLGDFETALARVHEVDRMLRESGRDGAALDELARIKTELVVLRGLSNETRLQNEWLTALDAELMRVATDGAVGFAEADLYVRTKLMKEAERRVAERLGFTVGDPVVADAWRRRPTAQSKVHSYGSASFLTGAGPARQEAWWGEAAPEERFAYLKGLHVESHRSVSRAEAKNCSTCGARGTVRGATLGSSVPCPVCLGAQTFRVLVYR